jgi:hypothetical protein
MFGIDIFLYIFINKKKHNEKVGIIDGIIFGIVLVAFVLSSVVAESCGSFY